jgi:hypothetical protein
MTEESSTRSAREPWEGYAGQATDERTRLLEKKVQDAKQQGDYAYAMAVSSAVANYELVQQLQPDTTHDEQAAAKAHELHDLAGSWIGS